MANNRYLQLQRSLLESVQGLRMEDDDLCDLTFLVGKDEAVIKANSTVLSLKSPYFKAMCFGPLRSDRPKVLPDMTPETFRKVLDYVHATDPSCLALASEEEAWDVRYAASQFLLTDLVEVCNEYLLDGLRHGEALRLLKQAAAYGADDFKKSIYRVMKNRHISVLSSDELQGLAVTELIDLIRLFKEVRTDYVIKAVFIWSKGLEDDEAFKTIFQTKLFRHIRWDNISNENMLELHEIKLLPLELENEAMVRILSRQGPLPEEETRTVCNLELQIGKQHKRSWARTIDRLVLRTVRSYKKQKPLFTERGSFVLDGEGMGMMRDVLRMRSLQGCLVLQEDLTLEFSVNHGGRHRVRDLRTVAYHLRHDNKDVFFFDLSFEGISIDRFVSGDAHKNVDLLFLEVSLGPELLRDLVDFTLPATEVLTRAKLEGRAGSDHGTSDFSLNSWQTFVNGKVELSNEDQMPKYFFQDTGVPIISQIN